MKKIDWCNDWKFKKKDGAYAEVILPHDAMIHEKREADNPSGSAGAYFAGGEYVYEKSFDVPSEWKDKSVIFEFEGVYKNSKVYINDNLAGGAAYGYIPFFVEADKLIEAGASNTVRVECENTEQPDSRWYTGAGIYRPVWMHVGEKVHIKLEGVRVSTVDYTRGEIKVEIRSSSDREIRTNSIRYVVNIEIHNKEQLVASKNIDFDVEEAMLSTNLTIPNAKLWSDESPNLYTLKVTLGFPVNTGMTDTTVIDECTTHFGIRQIEWSPKGLFINGKETYLRGACVHHDNGIIGAGSFAESEDRRVRKLKDMGYNAIRSAHNPAAKSLIEACDRYGIYVIDETWDMWFNHKSKFDYATDFMENYKFDITAMVNRDFNHPSVIMHSIGNEVSEPGSEKGIALAKEMIEIVHELDATRPVTGGLNLMIISQAKKGKGIYKEGGGLSSDSKKTLNSSTMFNLMTSFIGTGMNKSANSKTADEATTPVLDALDIAGYNYASGRYMKEGMLHPNRLIFGSETFSQDIGKNWEMVKKIPYLIGDFMWTGWDYLGECGLGAWAYTNDARTFDKPYPWLLADCVTFDICGNPGASAYYAKTVWGLMNKPYIGVRPVNRPGQNPNKGTWRGTNAFDSWAWRRCDGNKAEVEVYSTAPVVGLYINGRSVGKKKTKLCRAIFKTKYQPGTITAVAYDSTGKELSRSMLTSATGEIGITINPDLRFSGLRFNKNDETKDSTSITATNAGVGEIIYFDVSLVGENKVVESNADKKLEVSVEGGTLLAFGSANPRTEETFDSGEYTTYYGKALAVVRAEGDKEVNVTVKEIGK